MTRAILSILLLCGIAIAGYLTWHHDNLTYGDATASLANCPHTETIDCDLVNTSRWSEVLGIPIAVLAIPTYLLVLLLAWRGRSRPRMLSYAFCIGLMTACVSAVLFVVSKTQIGFLCLWCMRLYAVNISIPVLVAIGSGKGALEHVRETWSDLRRWPMEMRFSSVAFAILLGAALLAQHGYRARLERLAARDLQRILEDGGPTVPAVPGGLDGAPGSAPEGENDPRRPGSDRSSAMPGTPPRAAGPLWSSQAWAAEPVPSPSTAAPTAPGGPYSLAGPVRRLSWSGGAIHGEKFDLQARLGKGKPVALMFWHPGYERSEIAVAEWSAYFAKSAPAFEVYAVSGRRDDERDEQIWERWAMLDLPPGRSLLVDDNFTISSALEVGDVPNLALFDAQGTLIVAKAKGLDQDLLVPPGRMRTGEVVLKLASGAKIATIERMAPYYPATELYGRCAPPFALRKFNSTETYSFSGRPASKKPLLLIFWSSTCKHCQVEIPQVVAWQKEHSTDVEILSVTQIRKDRPDGPSHRKVTESYIRSQKIAFPVLEDPDNAVNDMYGVISTPTTFFIAPDGTVLDAWYYPHTSGFAPAIARELQRTSQGECRAPTEGPRPRLDFSVLGPDERRVPLASLLDKPSLVHFWATWCVPCIQELPSLLRLRDTLQKSGEGKVILVSVEDEAAGPRIEKFQRDQGLRLGSYRAPRGGLADRADLGYSVPRTFLLAPGGDVVGDRRGQQNWDDADVADRIISRLHNSPRAAAPVTTTSRQH